MTDTLDMKALWQAAMAIEAERAQWLCQQAQQATAWHRRMQTLSQALLHAPDAALLSTLQSACTAPAELQAALEQADLAALESLALALKAWLKAAPEPEQQLLQTWVDLLEAHFYASVPQRAPALMQAALNQLAQAELPEAWPVSAAELPHWAPGAPLAALQDLQRRCSQALAADGPAEGLQPLLRYLNASLILRQLA